MKHFELGPYKGLNVARFDAAVSEEELNEAMEVVRRSLGEVKAEKKDKPIEAGDYVTLDFSGTENGAPFPLIKEKDCRLRVGDDDILPEFSQYLLGKRQGDTLTFETVIQPLLVENQALWGRRIAFAVEITKVFTIREAELTEETIREIDPGANTLQDFKFKLAQEISKQKKERARPADINNVVRALAGRCKYEFDEESLERKAEDLYRRFAEELREFEDTELVVYLMQRKISAEDLLRECKEEAARQILRERILDAVIQESGITASTAETKALRERLLKEGGDRAIELCKDHAALQTMCLRQKALDFLLAANLAISNSSQE